MDHFAQLEEAKQKGLIPSALAKIVLNFYLSYSEAIQENGYAVENLPILNRFLELVVDQIQHPYSFEKFHQAVRHPIDYYRFGIDIIRPIAVLSKSKLLGLENLQKIEDKLASGDNVILFANHQTEPDPQAISLLLEEKHPLLAEQMIFVAGHRVIEDPLAIPFSLGRNLLCIFSKRYIEKEPEKKQERLMHNQQTMKKMGQLLSEGGKCIYVAPSGGRDRPNEEGEIIVAPFDPQSIELFWLIAKQAERPTHFHTLALSSYNLFPPPSSIDKNLGEKRSAHCTPIHLSFGPSIDMENCINPSITDKKTRRQARAEYIWDIVNKDYKKLIQSDSKDIT